MAAIRILSPEVVNKISAGEVIERPASIVKELVENALDAGAAAVRVEVEDGGRKLIRVVDDGHGIAPEDLPLAFSAHATSKLQQADDLFRVQTFGFRGEALASVGSVAQVRLTSRMRGSLEGVQIEGEAGRFSEVRPAGSAEGTAVEVRSLFLNVPVRRRFLRSAEIEADHVAEILGRFAVAHPRIRFEFIREGETLFVLPPAAGALERIGHFFGKELMEALIQTQREAPSVSFTAYLAPPRFSRVTLKGIGIYLNGRFIRDRVLQRAILEAYRELLPHGRFPVAFLFLKVEPGEVDVNVHPTKIEVRFRQVWKIHDLILETLRKALLERELPVPLSADRLHPPPSAGVRYQEVVEFFSRDSSPHPSPPPLIQTGRRFFQVHDRFIVEEAEDGIRIIDQHALHERTTLEELRRQFRKAEMPRQRLLIPATLRVNREERLQLEEHRHVLESLGIEFEDFGPDSVAVRSIPVLLKESDPATLVRDLLDRLVEDSDPRLSQVEHALEFMACHSAVTFGCRLGVEELERLLSERNLVEGPQTCAHGRPVSILLRFDELEKYFHRKG